MPIGFEGLPITTENERKLLDVLEEAIARIRELERQVFALSVHPLAIRGPVQ